MTSLLNRRFRVFLPALALVLLLLPAGAAQAKKVQKGVQLVHNTPVIAQPGEIQRMQQGHVDLIRTTFDWLYIEPTQNGGFNFSETDKLMTAASAGRKIEVLPILASSPTWISPKMPGDPPLGGFELGRWNNYVKALIARYGPKGSFWPAHPNLSFNPITAWQVWNEPNLKSFWTNQHPDAKEYAAFLKTTSSTIRSADNKAEVVLAGMPEREDAPRSMADFLEDLYKVKGFTKSIDVVAMHPFAEDEKGIIGGIKRIRKILDKHGDKKLPLWITEVGFASTGPASPFTQNENGQAKLLTKSFKAIDKEAKKSSVEKAVWYSWRDLDKQPPTNPGFNSWQTYTGLFTFSGKPKKSWKAYTKVLGGNAGSGSIP
ncbi:MAG: polysaccharide biosynthesis protein PslG [Thermoleophilaceae bacterium]|jgi:hypothetical protein|nr:polysaccharide biosynthesis protein PslG [Thermoleophilaceae bacterium]